MSDSPTKNVSDAVSSGKRIESLKALADKLAELIDASDSPRDVAALSLRLMKTLEQIEQLAPTKKETAAEKRKRQAQEKKVKTNASSTDEKSVP